ncbi:hypothetical protein C84B14_15111 [Salinisphaera sp. C84B14]|uniref:hypothetical protein n=1 Tax=Salinisphaera sp. C84B14 TaxID=1304155 RepID=UPI003340D5B5
MTIQDIGAAISADRAQDSVMTLLPCDFFGMAIAYGYDYLVFQSGGGCSLKTALSVDRARVLFGVGAVRRREQKNT